MIEGGNVRGICAGGYVQIPLMMMSAEALLTTLLTTGDNQFAFCNGGPKKTADEILDDNGKCRHKKERY